MKRVALAAIYVAFTLAGGAIAVRATSAAGRLEGLGCALFFALAGGLYFGKDLLGRGLRYQPSPPLRVGGERVELDRLVLGASLRPMLYMGLGALFFAVCAGVGFLGMGGFGGAFVGTASLLFVIGAIAVIVLVSRAPLVIFERDELHWRLPLKGWRSLPYRLFAGGEVVATANGELCGLHVRDLAAYVEGSPAARQREILKSIADFGAPIVLSNAVAPNAEQLLLLVAAYAGFPMTDAIAAAEAIGSAHPFDDEDG